MKQYKLVIVENDEDEQIFMKEGLEKAGGFDIIGTAMNGDDFIAWVKENAGNQLPDFVLSDLNMPGKNGYDVIDFVRSHPQLQTVPVIILSTSSSDINIRRCLSLGAAAYLTKPDTFMDYVPFATKLYNSLEKYKAAN